MEKQNTSRTGRLVARIFRVRSWVDYDRIKAFFVYMLRGTRHLVEPPAKAKRESFDTAVEQMGLSEAGLKRKQKALLLWSRLMCLVAILVVAWAVYHGINGHIRASLISLVVVGVALVLAFRYHFWYFQIKSRKLGCTLREWFEQGLLARKKP